MSFLQDIRARRWAHESSSFEVVEELAPSGVRTPLHAIDPFLIDFVKPSLRSSSRRRESGSASASSPSRQCESDDSRGGSSSASSLSRRRESDDSRGGSSSVSPPPIIVDIGCGSDCRLLIALCISTGCPGVGFEIDREEYEGARVTLRELYQRRISLPKMEVHLLDVASESARSALDWNRVGCVVVRLSLRAHVLSKIPRTRCDRCVFLRVSRRRI